MTLPTAFLSHGSPIHAIDAGIAGRAWAELGRALPTPRAILIASAHWETSIPMLTGSPRPETIHDFGGFPQELYRLRYPAPGALTSRPDIVARLKAADITAGIDGCRGLDHGAWVPLRWMYPDADAGGAASVARSGHRAPPPARTGASAADRRGILIIGSGHTTQSARLGRFQTARAR
jgi:4,5-DOPA dioxygenase extradiol